MPNWLRALIAGYGAKKLGGGCLSTILIFVVIYFVLGQCNHPVVGHAGQLKRSPAGIANLNKPKDAPGSVILMPVTAFNCIIK